MCATVFSHLHSNWFSFFMLCLIFVDVFSNSTHLLFITGKLQPYGVSGICKKNGCITEEEHGIYHFFLKYTFYLYKIHAELSEDLYEVYLKSTFCLRQNVANEHAPK